MKKFYQFTGVSLIILAIFACLPTLAARADCGIVWTGECSSVILTRGETTVRTSGTLTIHDFSQQWGEASRIIPQGYWKPQEGEHGVRWDCSDSYIHGVGIGWKVIYQGGAWHPVMEQVLTQDAEGRLPGDPGYIPTYTSVPVRYGHSAAACRYLTPGQIVSRVRWRDTRDELVTIPFQDITIIPWEKIVVVTNYYHVEVPLPYPAASVVRSPWPRAIAGEPEDFTATGVPVEAASDPLNGCTPDITDYVLQVRLTPLQGIPPVWDFDERPWSHAPATGAGWEISHTYDTASYNMSGDGSTLASDKPAIGPSLDGATKLPSYKVNLTLAWLVEARRTWVDFYGDRHDTGWQAVDLRKYGYDTPYLVTTGARDVTPPPAGVPKQALPAYIVPVPVIESQGILSAP
jgi:hypothetical protein